MRAVSYTVPSVEVPAFTRVALLLPTPRPLRWVFAELLLLSSPSLRSPSMQTNSVRFLAGARAAAARPFCSSAIPNPFRELFRALTSPALDSSRF